MAQEPERRRHPRQPTDRAVKVYHEPSRRYRGGVARDLSAGGALVELHSGRRLMPGESVRLTMAGHRGLARHDEMLKAVVVRGGTSTSGRQFVAVRFTGGNRSAIAA